MTDRKIAVVGLGYVGLPVAVALGLKEKGQVVAFDINEKRIKELKQGKDHTNEVEEKRLKNSNLLITSDLQDLKKADFHIVTVPTPIDDAKRPDLSPVISASKSVGSVLKKGDIVVYESTVYPGVTQDVCVPILEKQSNLVCNRDFFVGYSPERINPGDKVHRLETITKVVSASNKETLEIVADIYSSIVEAGVHKAPDIKTAEAAKVIENTQRDLNIALMNELAIIFDKLDIDTKDVLDAAGTKWNFLKFIPGLVGGHCIGVDPYYLTHRAEQLGYHPQVILAGRHINDGMGAYVAKQTIKHLLKSGVREEFKVTILGATFKENCPDIRNTRVFDIKKELESFGIKVDVCDINADKQEVMNEYGIKLVDEENITPSNAVILAVPHKQYLDKGWGYITSFLKDKKGFVADIKSQLKREEKPEGITLWRL